MGHWALKAQRVRGAIRAARRCWYWLPERPRSVLLAAGVIGVGKGALQVYLQLRPTNTPPRAGFVLDSCWRRWYRGASGTLRAAALGNYARVLEVGGGVGTFTVPLAQRVAPDGRVYSIELQSGMLKQQVQTVQRSGLCNIHLHRADVLDLPFADRSFDRAVLIAVLPLLRDKQRGLREVRRVLTTDGLLVVSEDLVEPEYVPLWTTRRWCGQAGFVEVEAVRDGLCYTAVFRPGRSSGVGAAWGRARRRRRALPHGTYVGGGSEVRGRHPAEVDLEPTMLATLEHPLERRGA